MSDSTKTIQEECYGTCWGAQQRIDELTQYLNEANQRIKQLEESGNEMYDYCDPSRWDSTATAARKLSAQNAWNKAKEDKL